MKILCIHQGYELYGSDRSFVDVIMTLKTNYPQAHITVILPKEGPILELLAPLIDDIRMEELSVIRKKDIQDFNFKPLVDLFKTLKKNKSLQRNYDLVYINSIVVLGHILADTVAGTKRIIHVREIPTGIIKHIFTWLLNFRSAYFIFNSEATQDAFVSLKSKNKFVVYNGFDGYSNVRPINDVDKLNLLLIGRINSWKGHLLLLKALKEIVNEGITGISVRFVGDVFENQNHFIEELHLYINKNRLTEFVSFHPFSGDAKLHYEWADVVVVPSTKPEPFGRVAIEAMSAGRVVIAANHGGLKEIVKQNETGLLFEPGDVGSLKSSVLFLAKNPNRILDYGLAGKHRFQEYFTSDIHAEKISETFDIILKDLPNN